MRHHADKADRLWYLGLLILTIAYYLVPWGTLSTVNWIVGLPFLLFYTIVLPGIIVDSFFTRRERDVFETFTYWAFHGLLVLLGCCFAWVLSGISLYAFQNSLPVVFVVLAVAAARKKQRNVPQNAAAYPRRDKALLIGFGGLLAILGVLLLASGAAVDHSSDALDHIGYINEVADTGEPFPTTAIYFDPGANGQDLRKGLLHAVYGFYKSYLGADTIDLLRVINAFWSLLLLLAVYTSANGLFRNRTIAVLSSVFFLIGFGEGIRSAFIRTTFYPNRFALGYLLLFLSASLTYLDHRGMRLLVMCALYSFAAVAVHVQYAVFLAVSIMSIGIWKTCFENGTFRAHLAPSLQIGVAAVSGLLPYAVYRFITAYQASDLHRQIQGAVFIADGLFVADPALIKHFIGLMGLAAVISIVPLWNYRRREKGLGYLVASLLTVLLIVFNPLVLPVFYKAITYLTYRLVWICPFYMLTAYFIVDCFRSDQPGAPRRRLRRFACAVLVLAILVDISPVFRRNTFSPESIGAERHRSHLRWEDGLERLRTLLPENSVIASDPLTSYTIAAFTPHYVVATLGQHAPPNDLLVRSRILASRDILSPFTSALEKADLIADFAVTHVVVNGRLHGPYTFGYWMTSDSSIPSVRRRLLDLPDLFEKTADDDGFLILRCSGEKPSHADPPRIPALRRRFPPEARKVGEVAGVASLEAVQFDGTPILETGDTLGVTLWWSRRRPLPIDKYVATIRLDRVDAALPFGGKPFPKIARKLRELFEGERYRFRSDHKILDGFFDPNVWPEDQYVMDKITVRVPLDVAAGRYAVRAILLTRSTVQNIRLRDFFYDDDIYHGVKIGEITVRRP